MSNVLLGRVPSRIGTADRQRILELYSGKIGTPKWRDYSALSRGGYANILESGRDWGLIFGASTRDVELTERGRAVAELLVEEVAFWQPTAERHRPRLCLARPQRCFCWACATEFRWLKNHGRWPLG